MKFIYIFLFVLCVTLLAEESIVQVNATHYTKMPFLIGMLNNTSRNVVDILAKDLMFSGQFNVDIKSFTQLPTKKNNTLLFEEGYPLVLFVNESNKCIEWRLYDTMSGHMIAGKKYNKKSSHAREWAHSIADTLWPILTGTQGCFSSKIAYCKTVISPASIPVKHIYIADYDGSNAQELVAMANVVIAPRWNNDFTNPLLFYSQYTDTNVRLMSIDMSKKTHVASNFEGINMLPHFSTDGKSVVYCASKGNGNCQIYYYHKGSIKQLTHNNGNNFAPIFAGPTNKVYFCSDYRTGIPHIYSYDLVTDAIMPIAQGAYCASPSYCAQKNQLVYSRMVKGNMQLCMYDIVSGKHYQLTYDISNKQECAWSPCGNYILFSVGDTLKGQLITLNVATGERKNSTFSNEICSYPAWSICYNQFPVVVG